MIVVLGETDDEQGYWSLFVYGCRIDLGHGLTFCTQYLGLTPTELIEELGTDRLDTITGKRILARYIVKKLGINKKNVIGFKPEKAPFHLRK